MGYYLQHKGTAAAPGSRWRTGPARSVEKIDCIRGSCFVRW